MEKRVTLVNEENLPRLYNLCRGWAVGAVPKDNAIQGIVEATGMAPATALFHMQAMKAMFEGKPYVRRINLDVVEYFLEHIQIEYGDTAVKRAAEAVLGAAKYARETANFRDVDEFEKVAQKYLGDAE